MKEDFLHYLWKYQKIPQNCLLTSGEVLNIQSFGEYNQFSGADFFNALLKIGNQKWAGNVEMHLKSSYWYAHKHEQDPAYNNVILHVVWEHDVEVFNQSGQPIPTLELKNKIKTNTIERYQKLLFSKNYFINCEKNFVNAVKEIGNEWKKQLFIERLEQKLDFISDLLKENKNDWEKVLFLMLLKNFGGTVNGDAFLEIGKNIDFGIIRKERHNPLFLESLFLGTSNLLSDSYNNKYTEELINNFTYLRHKYQLKLLPIKIEFTKLRPQSFPTIRLSQLAQLYEKTDQLFSQIIDYQSITDLKKLLSVATSHFWETHYTFGKISGKSKKKVSNEIINRILINTVIPIKYLYFKRLGKDISNEVISDICTIPTEKNNIISHFQNVGEKPTSAFDTQVLLQLYKNYCQKNRCLECKYGIFLMKKEE